MKTRDETIEDDGRALSFEEFKERYDEYLFHKSLMGLFVPLCFIGSIGLSLSLIFNSIFLLINIIIKIPIDFSDLLLWLLLLFTDLYLIIHVIKYKSSQIETITACPNMDGLSIDVNERVKNKIDSEHKLRFMFLKIISNIVKAVCFFIVYFIIILAFDIIISCTLIDRVPLVGVWMEQLGM